jgi:hypothetical protein
MTDQERARALAERIKAWREDERAGYDQAIDLLGTAEDVLNGLEADYAAALSAARQEEREACAAIALNCRPKQSLTALKWSPPFSVGYEAACEDIEQAIRARGEAGQ